MCDYSLEMYGSRPAREGEIYVTTRFPSGSIGFASAGDKRTAVCMQCDTKVMLTDIPPALQVALRRLVRMGAEGNTKAVESMLKIALEHGETLAENQNSAISKMTVEERVSRISELLTRAQRKIDAREGKQTKGALN